MSLMGISLRSRRLGKRRSISFVVPLVIIIVLVIAFVAGYFAGSGTSTATSVETSTVASTHTVTGVAENPTCVTVQNCPSAYSYIQYGASQDSDDPGLYPSSMTVVIGINNTVTWQNEDSVTQTLVGANNLFNSGPLAPGATFSYTFTTAGTFTYSSPTYAWEKGTITVVQSTATTSAAGSNPDDNY